MFLYLKFFHTPKKFYMHFTHVLTQIYFMQIVLNVIFDLYPAKTNQKKLTFPLTFVNKNTTFSLGFIKYGHFVFKIKQ